MTNRLAYTDETGNVTRVIIADPSFDPSALPCGDDVSAGYIHDAASGLFYPPQPFASWTMSPDAPEWLPPVPMPETGGPWVWDEPTLSWVEVVEPQ